MTYLSTGSDPDPKPRSSWWLRLLFTLLFVALAAAGTTVAALVGFTFLRLTDAPASQETQAPIRRMADPLEANTVSAEEPMPSGNAWDRHGPLNVLLIGVDEPDCANPDQGRDRRSDTIILVRVDPQTNRVAMLSIPRDLHVSLPSGYPDGKINTAHYWGELNEEQPGRGPGLLKQVIYENLGLSIHRWVRIDYEGFERIVDELGGIEVDVPPSPDDPTVGLRDTQYPDGHCGYMTIDFAPGEQTLDGEEALQYARSRYSTSDFDRSRRQMEVLMAVREQGTRPSNLLRAPKLIGAFRDTVDTDFAATEILSLLPSAAQVSPEDVVRLRIDENAVYDRIVAVQTAPQQVTRQYVLFPYPDRVEELVRRFEQFEPLPTPTPTPDVGQLESRRGDPDGDTSAQP